MRWFCTQSAEAKVVKRKRAKMPMRRLIARACFIVTSFVGASTEGDSTHNGDDGDSEKDGDDGEDVAYHNEDRTDSCFD